MHKEKGIFMKHIKSVSQNKTLPATAASLLVKQAQLALVADGVAILTSVSDLLKDIAGTANGE